VSRRRVQPWAAATRVLSVRCELIAQDRGQVLALAQQPDHIQVVSAFEAAPQQRELCDLPSPKPWNARELSERRRANARLEFDLVKRGASVALVALVALTSFTATRVAPSLR
jgi:hypothetical protein